MADEFPRFTAAAVQAAPVYLDREATIDKACRLIEEAAAKGAKLIVFPETWVPGYPFWVFGSLVVSSTLFVRLFKNAVEIPSPATDALCRAAAAAGAYVVIGINERDARSKGSLYNTLLYIDDEGEIMGAHRKLMPTHAERTVWGMGDGSGLHVFDTPLGRLGGLICWEHEMPLVRYAMFGAGEQVHASVWPAFSFQNHHIDFGCRQYAFEGACFVVAACGYMTEALVPEELGIRGQAILDANGGSGIIGPDGEYLAGPLYGKEDILYADIDLERTVAQKHLLDVAGHYSRPDVVQLVLHNELRRPVVLSGEGGANDDEAFAMLDDIVAEAEERGAQQARTEMEEEIAPRNRAERRSERHHRSGR
jgi:aliphatic nitrilase